MNLGPNAVGLILGVVVLVTCAVLIPGRRRAAIRSTIIGAVIGAVAYPLALCLVMGMAGASARPDGHAWVRFRVAFTIYAQSALEESIPRGAVLGAFVATCWVFLRRTPTPRPTGTPPDVASNA